MEIGEIAGTQQVHGADAAIGLARIALQSVHAGKLPTADQCEEGELFAPRKPRGRNVAPYAPN